MSQRRRVPDHTVITGAAGWLGRALTSRLGDPAGEQRRGGLVLLVRNEADIAAVATLAPQGRVVVGDVTRLGDVEAMFAGLSGDVDVIHTAGVIHPRRIREFDEVNAGGTRNVLAAAANAGARRLVHVSSNSPFGTNPDVADVFRGEEPYDPYFGYGRSKMQAELDVREHVDRGALDAVIVRPPWFYGPFQPERQTTFFTMIRRGRFPVIGSGEQRRSMVYVDNLVDGVLLAELVATPPGRAWWIADARPYSMNEIVATVGRALRDEGFAVRPNRVRVPAIIGRAAEAADRLLQRAGAYHQSVHVLGEMDKTIAVEIDAATTELGYEPGVALYEGMRASIRWCIEQGIDL